MLIFFVQAEDGIRYSSVTGVQTCALFFQAEDGIRDSSVTGVQTCALFFQAEDGIRDSSVTGVQTCALPILCLLLPALSAWAAFILCRYIVRQRWISLLSGYIYGFSPYILGEQIFGHLHLTAALFVPLFVYLVLLHLDGGIARVRFIALMTLLFVLQFLSALEIFATVCFCGAIALAIAALVIPAQARMRIYRLGASIALCLTIALALLSSYLYYLFSNLASL